MAKRPSASLRDVARLAGCSISTSSRALTQPHLVREETVKAVQHAAKKLGYIPHAAGRALSSRRTRTVGAVLPTLDNAIFANTAYALQKRLGEHEYMLLLACSDFSLENELKVARMLLERGVDGLVLTGLEHDPALLALLEAAGVPFVFTWAFDESLRYDCVGFDNRKAGALMANHIAQLGHAKIAVISAYTRHNERQRERLNGIKAALDSRGIELPEERIIESEFSYRSGREGVRKLLVYDDTPTAIICTNDVIAIGAMAECQEMGLRIPADISISGFEDLQIASNVVPALTTVRWSQHALGTHAADLILARLASDGGMPRQIEVPLDLIVRDTTAPPGRLAVARHQLPASAKLARRKLQTS